MRLMRRSASALPILLAITLAGCAVAPVAPPTSAEPTPSADLLRVESELDDAVEVVDGFWREQWSNYFSGDYTSPTVVGIYDGDDTANALTCDGDALPAKNAYYCPEEDYLAWDSGLLLSGSDIGPAWPYFIVAHEWGHAIEARIEPEFVAEQNELQADCFAGAALAEVAAEGLISYDDLLEIGAKLQPRQWNGGEESQADAGRRLAIFQQGQELGVAGCLDLP